MNLHTINIRSTLSLIVLLCVASFFLFYQLGEDSLQSWDEGIYTLIYRDVSFTQHGATLTLHGEPWFEKPPFGFWLNGFMVDLFGINELAIRFLPAMFSVGAVVVCYLLGTVLFNRTVGFLTSLTLVVSPVFLYDHISRRGDLEGGYLLLTLLVLYFFVRSWEKPRLLVFCGVFLGLAYMYRGALAVLSLMVIGVTIAVYRLWRHYNIRIWAWSVIVFVLIVVPWHLQQFVLYGVKFFKVNIGEHVLKRAGTPFNNHGYPWNYYLSFLHWKMGVLLPLGAFFGFVEIVRAIKKKVTRPFVFLLLWILIFLIPLSVARTKLYWYLTPALPALTMLPLAGVESLVRKFPRRFITFACALLLVLVFFSYARASARQITSPKKDPLPLLVEELERLSQGQPLTLVTYDVQSWMRGWLEPQAEYYLRMRHPGWTVINVNKEGFQERLKEGNRWLLVSSDGLSEFGDLSKDYKIRYDKGGYFLLSKSDD